MGIRMDKRRYYKVALSLLLVVLITSFSGQEEPKTAEETHEVIEEIEEVAEEAVPVPQETPPEISRGTSEPRNTPLTPSRMTIRDLENRLPDEFFHLSGAFFRAEEETGVNSLFLASVAGLESGWGKSSLARNHNNLFGLSGKSFETVEEGIIYAANLLKRHYLTEGGKYFKGYTIRDVQYYYCPSNPEWSNRVIKIMKQLEDNNEKV